MNTMPSQAPTQLLAALEARMTALKAVMNGIEAEVGDMERKLHEARDRWNAAEAEYKDLARLHGRYADDQEFVLTEPQPETNGVKRLSARDAIEAVLRSQPELRMRKSDLVDRIERDIGNGKIKTETKHPRKLASTIVGQMRGERVVTIDEDGFVVLKNGGATP